MSYKNKKNKQFGYLFFLLFLILSLWPMLNSEKINLVLLFISLTFLILTILNSKILNPLSDLWIKFGELLGKFIAPIVMSFVFFIILTPTSFIIRLFGKDLLKLKFNKESSYWLKREKDIGAMKKQF
tara:strand:+ start:205 stop:585 length:381 start_codon:yes stop_codon:yes gene_type:complete